MKPLTQKIMTLEAAVNHRCPKNIQSPRKLQIYEKTRVIWVSHRTQPHNQAPENTYISVSALWSLYYQYKQRIKSFVVVSQDKVSSPIKPLPVEHIIRTPF